MESVGSVLVVGESLVDIVHGPDGSTVEYAGGSAANVAVALARLDRRVRFVTAWADDERGRVLADHLAAAGVELAGDPHVLDRTATAAATIGADGAASYEFDLEWRIPDVSDEPAPLVLHTCSLGAVLEPGADGVLALVERLRDRASISYDVNARPAITGTGPDVVALVERLAAVTDLVKASDEDLAHLYPQRDEEAAARHLLALGPAAVIVTRGGNGVDALWERGLLGAERRPDLRRPDPGVIAEVLAHAARAAAVTVSRPGADPPYRSEL
ncbi:MAG: carbohydrate kinase [Nocardioides sp.]|nr:carbohydrate kinase [Nocardioides sp.]